MRACFVPGHGIQSHKGFSRTSTQTLQSPRVRPVVSRPCNRVSRRLLMYSPPQFNSDDKAGANDGRANAGIFGLRIEKNGDVIKFGVAFIAAAYAFKTLLTLLGVRDLLAGQITTGLVSVASLLAWISSYLFRVGTKGMTYAQQLRDYENAVLQKRLEELTPEELEALSEELEEGQ